MGQMTCIGKEHFPDTETVNQQATQFELGWLMAFLEGEGSLGLYWNTERRQIYPTMTFVNTERPLLERCGGILNKLGVGHFFYHHKMNGKLAHWKDRMDVHVNGIKRLHRLLELILPLWDTHTVKRDRAKLVFEFCKSRLSNPVPENGRYTNREFELLEQFIRLNGKTPETTRSPWSTKPIQFRPKRPKMI